MPHLLRKDQGRFEGGYNRGISRKDTVSVISSVIGSGSVFLDLPGLENQRIGTYLMNQVVTWTQQWPEASVDSIRLVEGQAQTEREKQHRNAFYRQFGIEFDFENPEEQAGVSKPMLAKELKTITRWKDNIEEVSVYDFAADILSNEENLRQSVNRLVKEQKWADAHPIQCFWWRLRASLGV